MASLRTQSTKSASPQEQARRKRSRRSTCPDNDCKGDSFQAHRQGPVRRQHDLARGGWRSRYRARRGTTEVVVIIGGHIACEPSVKASWGWMHLHSIQNSDLSGDFLDASDQATLADRLSKWIANPGTEKRGKPGCTSAWKVLKSYRYGTG